MLLLQAAVVFARYRIVLGRHVKARGLGVVGDHLRGSSGFEQKIYHPQLSCAGGGSGGVDTGLVVGGFRGDLTSNNDLQLTIKASENLKSLCETYSCSLRELALALPRT